MQLSIRLPASKGQEGTDVGKKVMLALAVLCAAMLLGGCVFPGSSVTVIRVKGRVIDPRGDGIPRMKVELLFPAEYGLSQLDAKYANASKYGHYNQVFALHTNDAGEFQHTFEPVTYSVMVRLIPPGRRPEYPPPPQFALRIGDVSSEGFAVSFQGEKLVYRKLDWVSRQWTSGVIEDMDGFLSGALTAERLPCGEGSYCDGWTTEIVVKVPRESLGK